MSERDLQRLAAGWINAQPGCLAVHVPAAWGRKSSAPGQRNGAADLFCCVAGRFLAIELKTPSGKQRPDQVRFEGDVSRAKGRYVVARSLDEVKAAVAEARG